jgi:uncharacterized membrane protein YccC
MRGGLRCPEQAIAIEAPTALSVPVVNPGLRLAAWAHPARLPVAGIDTLSVFASSALVVLLVTWFGLGTATLPAVLGGLLCFNLLLFLPPGGVATGASRLLVLLLLNLVPAAVALLHSRSPAASDLLLVVVTGVSILARRRGVLAGTIGLLAGISVMIGLILSDAPHFASVAAIGAPVGVLAAAVGDAVASRLAARYGVESAQALSAAQLADFLQALSSAWDDPARPWPSDRLASRLSRLRATLADIAALPTPGGGPPRVNAAMLVPHHLLDSIVHSLGTLQAARDAIPQSRLPLIGEALHAVALAAARGDLTQARETVERLRTASASTSLAGETGQPVTLLGLALLLLDLVETAAGSPAAPSIVSAPAAEPARRPVRVGDLLGTVEARLAVQSVLAVGLALLAGHLLPLTRPYWVPLTALILTTNSLGENLRKSIQRIVGTALGLLLGQVIWLAAGDVAALVEVFIVLSVFGIYFNRGGNYGVMLFWLSVLLSIVLHVAGGASAIYIGRLIDTLIGAAIALFVTVFVIPVHTRDAARDRIADLLASIAARLADIAAALASPGPHRRTGAAELVAPAAAALRGLAEAEWLEASVLHAPRLLIAQRIEAAERSTQFLLYLDELLPALGRCLPRTLALATETAQFARGSASAVRSGDPCPPRIPQAEFDAADDALLAAYRAGGLPAGQLHVERRTLRMLAALADSVAALAASPTPAVRWHRLAFGLPRPA